jgi:nitroreductase
MEAGHAAQNLYLQNTAMGLATVAVGAFHDEQVWEVLGLPMNERPLYILPVGRKREGGTPQEISSLLSPLPKVGS